MARNKSAKRKPVPVAVITEIKTALALRGYSQLTTQDRMSIRQQYQFMATFYHGKNPTHPSQVDLLEKGAGVYRQMYDLQPIAVTNKDYQGKPYLLVMKDELFVEPSTKYVAGLDIKSSELEKKSRRSKMLITGRNLYDLAKRSVAKHKKAIGYASELWDIEKNEPYDSGTKKSDVIEHVRCKMFFYMKKKTERRKDGYATDDSDSAEVDDVEEEKLMDEMQDEVDANADETSAGFADSIDDDHPQDVVVEKMPDLPNMTDKERRELARSGDEDYVPDAEVVDDEGEEDEEEEDNQGDDQDGKFVPPNFFFPGFMAFVLWGPFCSPDDRLRTVLVSGLSKSEQASRATIRAEKKTMKNIDREGDVVNVRGYSTDQQISMQSLKVQTERLETQKQEVTIASLSMHNTMLDKMLERYERRAERVCPVYDEKHPAWIKVDALLTQQEELMDSMQNVTSKLGSVETKSEKALSLDNDQVIDITNADEQVGNEVICSMEDIHSTMTTPTTKLPDDSTTPKKKDTTKSSSQSPMDDTSNKSSTNKSTTKSPVSTSKSTAKSPTSEGVLQSTNTIADQETTVDTEGDKQATSTFGRALPSTITSNFKGMYQFDGKPIWFCAAGIQHCRAPHVEVGKLLIHKCSVCKERLHTFCVSTNDDGVMICAGCDPNHSYGDSIEVAHPVVPKWKSDLIKYYKSRDGIPDRMCFLVGEYHLQKVNSNSNTKKRQTRNSKRNAPAVSTRNSGKRTRKVSTRQK